VVSCQSSLGVVPTRTVFESLTRALPRQSLTILAAAEAAESILA
jgi:hypothetical protein